MTIDRAGFRGDYRALSATLAGEFYESTPVDDALNARRLGDELPPDARAELLETLLGDARRLMRNIEKDWETMAYVANRDLPTVAEAGAWLALVIEAWEGEVSRLRS